VDLVIIVPDKGKDKEIAQQLLELADSPLHVQWVSWPTPGFRVPVELAAKLKGIRDMETVEAEASAMEQPTAKRRGRPRKVVEEHAPVLDTDNEKEE
jgi:hypothetical protein